MARICPECGVLCIEDWRYMCDDCDADLRFRSCYCPHDMPDQCICNDWCPAYDRCPGFWGQWRHGVELLDPPEPVLERRPVNPAERRPKGAEG